MKKLRFIHAADLHLDSPMIGLRHLPKNLFARLKESTFVTLKKIIDAAIHYKVDFVLIAGDLYDGEDRSIKAQAVFKNEMERLAEKGIRAYVIHGNHDHLGGSGLKMKFPDNVFFFQDRVEPVLFQSEAGTTAHIYGFSYPKRHVMERWIEKYEKKEGADFHIGMLHGHSESASDHGKYAPFRLSELIEKNFDYWALGHIHKRSILNQEPPVIYPGNPQGRNRKETGIKGVYLVELSPKESNVTFIETADIVWEEEILEGKNIHTFDELYMHCLSAIDRHRMNGRGVLLSIFLKNIDAENVSVIEKIVSEELIEILQDSEKEEDSFVLVHRLGYSEEVLYNREELIEKSDFFEELFASIEEYEEMGDAISSLYQHPVARRLLEEMPDDEKEELLMKSERTLLELLLKN